MKKIFQEEFMQLFSLIILFVSSTVLIIKLINFMIALEKITGAFK